MFLIHFNINMFFNNNNFIINDINISISINML